MKAEIRKISKHKKVSGTYPGFVPINKLPGGKTLFCDVPYMNENIAFVQKGGESCLLGSL